MPTFEVQTNDGKRFQIEAADHDAAAKVLSQHTGKETSPSMFEGLTRAFSRGVPIIGGALDKANAATNAALAPLVDPLLPDSMEKLPEPSFGGRYEHALRIQQGKDKRFQEEHPIADAVAEVAGGVASMGGAAATQTGAKLLGLTGNTLKQLATRGAASGAAVSAADAAVRGENPLSAGGVGAAVGAVAPVVGRAVNAKVVEPIAAAVRGARNPTAEAERRVASALDRDIRNNDRGLTLREMTGAQAEGQPAALMDAGGEVTRALARSSANTSPEGRSILSRTIDDRFESQAPRLADWLSRTSHYPNATAQQDALDKVAKTVNRGAYAKAYREGDKEIISDELHRLMGSPAVVEAMRKAAASGKDRAITQGMGAMRQGATVENGVVNFTKGKNGAPTYPNLAYWDAVKRELDDATAAAQRAGRKEEASTLTQLTRGLRDELDRLVPSYGNARAGAAAFFGAGDAIEAGQNFVGASRRFGVEETRKALSKMSPIERQLFQDGYVSRLVQTIEQTGDRRSVLNKIGNSRAARAELVVALGPQRAKEVEARLRIEGIMDLARPAVQGNSTTARQLVELGLAGGVGGYESYQGDPQALVKAALVYGAARGKRVIDERVAKEVAKLLVSSDVRQLQRGLNILTRNQNMMGAIRQADAGLASIAARGAEPTASRAIGAQ